MLRRRNLIFTLTLAAATCFSACQTKKALPAKAPPAKALNSRNSLGSLNDQSDPMTQLAAVRIERQISMHYSLDLQQNNNLSLAMSRTLRIYDNKIRTCYTQRLESVQDLRGKLALKILISKTKNSIDKISRISGLEDGPLLNCITTELSLMQVKPPYDLPGTLTYSFDVIDGRAGIRR